MNRYNHISVTLMDFIMTFRDMDGIFSDNSRIKIVREVKYILIIYSIKYIVSEPNNQHHNYS